MEAAWRFVHLGAAALWLGGMVMLGVAVLVALRRLERPAFRTFAGAAGRAFAVLSVVSWILIGVSGLTLASARVPSVSALPDTSFGRTLEAKTILAGLVVVGTLVHVATGRLTGSRPAIMISRTLAVLVLFGTLGVYWLAAHLD